MTDDEMVLILRDLCAAYVADDRAKIGALEPKATAIGEELHRKGGLNEMRRVFGKLGWPARCGGTSP